MIALYCTGAVVAIIVIAVIVGVSYEISASRRAARQFADAPGDLIAIGERKLHLNIRGERREGQPVVVLEPSVGANSLDWQLVQPTVAEQAQVISYDRAGNGWSDQTNKQRTAETIAEDLHNALRAAGIAPPYVLCGHRYGGLYVRKYQEMFPDDVAAVVLIDASHPDVFDDDNSSEIRRLKTNVNIFQPLGIVRYVTQRNYRVVTLPEDRRERYAAMMMHDNANLLKEARPVLEQGINVPEKIDIPVTVVSRYEDEDIERERRWADRQKDFLTLSDESRHVQTEPGNNWIVFSDPVTIAGAILETVDRVTPNKNEEDL